MGHTRVVEQGGGGTRRSTNVLLRRIFTTFKVSCFDRSFSVETGRSNSGFGRRLKFGIVLSGSPYGSLWRQYDQQCKPPKPEYQIWTPPILKEDLPLKTTWKNIRLYCSKATTQRNYFHVSKRTHVHHRGCRNIITDRTVPRNYFWL